MHNLHKVLVVCHGDETRKSAYEIISHLSEFGYSSSLCHVNDEEEAPSKVNATEVLDGETSLSGYDGVIFLDDGGDEDAALGLAKKADKKKIVVGGHGPGALLLGKAGLLKDERICDGLPEECYEKATRVMAPSVRSDRIVTSSEGCAKGFAILMVDALGGKVKNVVNSELPEDDESGIGGLSLQTTSEVIAAFGGPRKRTVPVGQLLATLEPGQKVLADDWTVVRRIQEGFLVSDLRTDSNRIMSAKEAASTLGGSVCVSPVVPLLRANGKRYRLAWEMARGPKGWKAAKRLAYSGEDIVDAVDLLKSVLGDEGLGLGNEADRIAEEIAVVLQALMENSDGSGTVVITLTVGDDGSPLPLSASGSLPILRKASNDVPCECPAKDRRADPAHRRLVERELANEDVWIQPDGSAAMLLDGEIKRFRDFGELVLSLREEARRALKDEVEAVDEGDMFEARRAARLSLRNRHRLRMAMEMVWLVSGNEVRLAGPYPSTVAGPYSHLELPLHERVFTWQEGDDWLGDREKAISDLPRYNPQYDKITPGSQDGFYYVWDEQRRMPSDWLDIMSGEDSVYPMRNLLKKC
jgi:hypothetical protein